MYDLLVVYLFYWN